ncbi:MAG: phosphoglycerate kinase [Deltaproteobacteria bacterium RBG_13_49_15]|nr:MAG: phosphoglycerate kinase [Deltaproteobacteria bacterium RBG_13_49_15]
MKYLNEIDIAGKRVLVRVDFNVPLDEKQQVRDDMRIKTALPTLTYILAKGAKLIVASHLGRPKGKTVSSMSLRPVADHLSRLIGKTVRLAPDCIGTDVLDLVSRMQYSDLILLENLRFHPEEEKNEDGFAKDLAALCDVYVNDAFGVSHRANASISAITKFAPVSAAGFLMQKEITYVSQALNHPQRPFVAIVGGAKVSGKLPAIENILKRVDKLIVGGAMANTFLKSLGLDMGQSLVEDEMIGVAVSVMKQAADKGVKFYMPVDVVAAERVDAEACVRMVPVQEIPPNWTALDIGPATLSLYSEALYDAKTVIWNGPMGMFEMSPFSRGTMGMVQAVASSHALTIVGGGETGEAVQKSGISDRITYISTGGGAFLSLLEGKVLPGVAALEST